MIRMSSLSTEARQSATQRNLMKCLHMNRVSTALMVKYKKMTNRSAFLAVKHMLMVRKVVWVRRRRRVLSVKRTTRRKRSKSKP